MDNYHLSRGGKTLGIYPEDSIREYIAQGRVAPGDLVWKAGMQNWVPARQVFEFPQEAPAPTAEAPVIEAYPPATVAAKADPVRPPPAFHWGWVLLLSVLTLGLFYVVWAFVQAVWVKRMDPSSNALTLLAVYLALTIVGEWLADGSAKDAPQVLVGALLSLVGAVVSIFAFFSMRRSLLARYGDEGIEPSGLRLGRVMTFFFNVLYFQYHLTRIAQRSGGGSQPT